MQINHRKFFIFTIFLVLSLIFISEFIGNKKPPNNPSIWNEPLDILIIKNKKPQNIKNIIFIEPFMNIFQYASEEIFYKKLDTILKNLQPYFRKDTIVIFPPQIGYWLITTEESFKIHLSKTYRNALFRLILYNPFSFLNHFFYTNFNIEKALYLVHSEKIFKLYTQTFAKLSKKYNINILAGTVFSRRAYIKENLLFLHSEPQLEEYSILFSDKGLPIKIIRDYDNITINQNNSLQIILNNNQIQKINKNKPVLFYNNSFSSENQLSDLCKNLTCYFNPFRGNLWNIKFEEFPIINSQIIPLKKANYAIIIN
ncbi:MAG: hypothetical protein KatS3mg129_2416 [Leptospiraceae bacterium]|nr:MAG: hypothetical protein KatS3mg129_2416 [Leptospiraceae bacterium]